MVWLNQVKKPKPTLITRIIIRPKGWVINGVDYDAFAWNDSKQQTQLSNAVVKAISEDREVPTIVVEPTKDGKFKLGLGTGLNTWRQLDSGFVSSLHLNQSLEQEPDELF